MYMYIYLGGLIQSSLFPSLLLLFQDALAALVCFFVSWLNWIAPTSAPRTSIAGTISTPRAPFQYPDLPYSISGASAAKAENEIELTRR